MLENVVAIELFRRRAECFNYGTGNVICYQGGGKQAAIRSVELTMKNEQGVTRSSMFTKTFHEDGYPPNEEKELRLTGTENPDHTPVWKWFVKNFQINNADRYEVRV